LGRCAGMITSRSEQHSGGAEGDERPRTPPPLSRALLRALHVLGSWSTNVVFASRATPLRLRVSILRGVFPLFLYSESSHVVDRHRGTLLAARMRACALSACGIACDERDGCVAYRQPPVRCSTVGAV